MFFERMNILITFPSFDPHQNHDARIIFAHFYERPASKFFCEVSRNKNIHLYINLQLKHPEVYVIGLLLSMLYFHCAPLYHILLVP